MNKTQRKHKVRNRPTEAEKQAVYARMREDLRQINNDHLIKQYAGPALILGSMILVILFTGYVIWRSF
tara:strand:- start:21868 stop:22071 length:204 start_codon:yes stop_codon:yes gene_type:complete